MEKEKENVLEAIKTYLDVMEKNKTTAENVARNLAAIVYNSLGSFYAADVERRKKVIEEFKVCANGFSFEMET